MFTVEAVDSTHEATVAALERVQRLANPFDYDVHWTLDELRVVLPGDEYVERATFAAFDGCDVVGVATIELPTRDNTDAAYVEIDVLPEARRKGVGTALFELVERTTRERGRHLLLAETVRGIEDVTSPGHEFALARGFIDDTLLATRALSLPAELSDDAEPRDGYRLESWVGPTPDPIADEYAALRALLNQEAPSGEIELENEFWDRARLDQELDQNARMGREMVTVVALSPANELVGHTQLVIPSGVPEVFQWDTLVLPEHRGHGLGFSLKTEAMSVAGRRLDGRSRIITWNDASNAPMIRVNEDLGYRQIGWPDQVARTLS